MSSDPIRVGIIGLGRSGWNIHANAFRLAPDRYSVVAVADPAAERREEAVATLGCRAYATVPELVGDTHLELVVVASPNSLHTEHAIAALKQARHVVCEKPFAMNTADADRMIEAARRANRVVAPFYNRRYESHLLQVQRVIASGILGQIVQIRLAWHHFGRRWDWQTLREFGGGALNNNGSHILDHALEVFGPGEPQIFADIRRTSLSSGDAEDHLKIILHGPGHPTVDIELTPAAAYPQDMWHIMGTAGGLRGTAKHLEWRWIDWSKMPARPVDRQPTPGRRYNSEKLEWQTASWDADPNEPPPTARFYDDLYEAIRHGQPLAISPQSIRRLISVMEQCQARFKP